jgi:hypothetical protein
MQEVSRAVSTRPGGSHVAVPFLGVVADVFADEMPFLFVVHDVIVVIALPDREPRGLAKDVDAPGGERFEGAHDLGQSMANDFQFNGVVGAGLNLISYGFLDRLVLF